MISRITHMVFLIAIICFLPLSTFAHEAEENDRGIQMPFFSFLNVGGKAPDFILIDQDENGIALSDFRGRPVLITFFYTSCPDVCSLVLKDFKNIRDDINEGLRKDLAYIAITVDPEVDTPDKIRQYIKTIDLDTKDMFLLTGNPEDVRDVLEEYKVMVAKDKDAKKVVDHSVLAYAIDREGVVRKIVFFSFDNL